MNLEFLEHKDFWSGVMLIVIGGGALFIARNYQFGTSLRMGPGYFPTVLGGGAGDVRRLLRHPGPAHRAEKLEGHWSLRALIVLPLSLVLFGLLIDRAGFIPAMLALIVGSAAAGTEFKLVEVLLFAVFLTAMCVIVFIWASACPTLITGIW